MRWIILLAIVLVVASGLGWFYIRDTDGKVEIIIDKEEVMTDTERVIERGREWIDAPADDADDRISEDEPESVQETEAPGSTETPARDSQSEGATP